ncbi:MAG: HAD hydrolase-like protein, partial [Promethearchaeota archaeon]
GAEFFATNADKTLPETKQIWPGSGTMMAAIQTCTDKPPKIIFGKPNRYGIDFIFKTLQNKYNTSKNSNNFMEDSGYLTFKDFLIIGDRLETDIAQGNNLGIDTVLVETGIHKKKDIPLNFEDINLKKLVPKFILKNLFEFFL